MRLLCDEMLIGLGRWLRAAGHDTAVADTGLPDEAVLAVARAERRLLLTRDRALAGRCAPGEVLLLGDGRLEEWAATLSRELAIDWCFAPFSRCLKCNVILVAAELPAPEVPPDRWDQPVLRCPSCRRHYWEGSHVRRMRRTLARFAGIVPGP